MFYNIEGHYLNYSFQILKITSKVVCILADKSGEIKANIPTRNGDIREGNVLEVEGFKDRNLDVKKYKFLTDYTLSDYLPTVKKPIMLIP